MLKRLNNENQKGKSPNISMNEDNSYNYSAICNNFNWHTIQCDNQYLLSSVLMTTLWPNRYHDTTYKKPIAFVDATDVENECFKQCPRDCIDVTYDFNIKMKKFLAAGAVNPLQINHDFKHDIVIKHFAEFPLMTYIASIGGLAGLWLGFSIISLYKNLVLYFKYIKKQYCMKKEREIRKVVYRKSKTDIIPTSRRRHNFVQIANESPTGESFHRLIKSNTWIYTSPATMSLKDIKVSMKS